jgi:hypothetical protein
MTANVTAPGWITDFCDSTGAHYVHISSQAVFSGEDPPYGADSPTEPINAYGRQKLAAEEIVRMGERWTIVRPTFILGVRPLPYVGRGNPLEQMLSEEEQDQVSDRWFSPLFAREAARLLWEIVLECPLQEVIHLGIPTSVCRSDIARAVNPLATVHPVLHDEAFPDIAPRPWDTTYSSDARSGEGLELGLGLCHEEWVSRESLDLPGRARGIAIFLSSDADECSRYDECLEKLSSGFGALHVAVAADFRADDPQGDEELLDWYRQTEAYIWELSAYHCDQGFAYSSLCEGVGQHLKNAGASRVLCLGDGIGDLTLSLHRQGLEPVYHDLAESRTANFAAFHFWMHTGQEMPVALTEGWSPEIGEDYDAIVSLDFLEHVVNVDEWAAAINTALRPGGLFFAQNAFAIGSGPDGSIPMHLTQNDRFEHDWLPLLEALGLGIESSNWFRRAA